MYEQIVVGTDGSAGASVAVDAAIELARLCGARLHVVHAHKVMTSYLTTAPEIAISPTDIMEANDAIHAEGERICEQVVARADRAGVQTETHCVGGNAADALIRVATDAGADLVVLGNRGMTGARRFVLGSVPNAVSHHCGSSLLIIDTTKART